jgi:hypothetical protein
MSSKWRYTLDMPVLHAKVQCQVSVHALDPIEEMIQESIPGVYALDQVEMIFAFMLFRMN